MNEEQEEEIEALKAIYDEDLTGRLVHVWVLKHIFFAPYLFRYRVSTPK